MSDPAKKRSRSPRTQLAIVVAGLLLVAALGFFLLVSPKRARSAELDAQIAAVGQQVAQARAASLVQPAPEIRTAEIYRLAKAMPDDADMAGILLELSRIAAEAGIEFKTISPGTPIADGPYRSVPIGLTFEGNFYSLSDFLFRLRSLVRVSKAGELAATGRLFSVSVLNFSQAPDGFPEIAAQLTVNAYVYGAEPGAAPAAPPPPAPSGETGTTTAPTTTEEAPAAQSPDTPPAPPAEDAPAEGQS